MVAVWSRSMFAPGGADAQLDFIVFAKGQVAGDIEVTEADGFPDSGMPEDLEIDIIEATADPAWFAGFLHGAFWGIAQRQLGEEILDIRRANLVYRIHGIFQDPTELDYLQAAWAIARWLCAHGCGPILDMRSIRFWRRADVIALDPNRAFDVTREVEITLETPRGIPTTLMHTRGLAKFGRPDLLVPGFDARRLDIGGKTLNALARSLALGTRIEPGSTIRVDDNRVITVEAYEPDGNAPEVHLNNEGIVLRGV